MKREELLKLIPTLGKEPNQPLVLFAGPCQLESEEHSFFLAKEIQTICETLGIAYVFKGSFDKANRTSAASKRGLGLNTCKPIFHKIQNTLHLATLTDIHLPEQAAETEGTIDILQIPAFLCRQTDLLLAAGATEKVVNIKKGQFLHPSDMRFAAEKVKAGGNADILLTERGTCFGYRELVVDMRSLKDMRALGYPVVFDGTHSVQSMGGAGGSSGGSREHIPSLCAAATAVGIDALFLEVHESPERAPSDAKSMLPLSELKPLLEKILGIREAAGFTPIESR